MFKDIFILQSHWYTLIEGLQESSQRFYELLEKPIEQRQLPGIKISRTDYNEGGVLSAKRRYFRVDRKEHVFEICAAPFGKGFFVSWRLSESRPSPVPSTILAIIAMVALIYYSGLFGGLFFIFASFFALGLLISEGKLSWGNHVLAIFLIGPVMERLFSPSTYYKIDTALMFQESVRLSVLEVLDEITKAKGLRVLSESERKPILRDLFKR